MYVAIDSKTGEIVRNRVSREYNPQELLPYESRIRFPGTVIVWLHEIGNYKLSDFFSTDSLMQSGQSFVYIRVDMERDIFCFGPCEYSRYGSSSRRTTKEWFRFLHNPINQDQPLLYNHWIFRVRNLALGVMDPGYTITRWDTRVLEGMQRLRYIKLVAPRLLIRPSPELTRRSLKYKEWFVEENMLDRENRDLLRNHTKTALKSIGEKIAAHDVNTKVTPVIDLLLEWCS